MNFPTDMKTKGRSLLNFLSFILSFACVLPYPEIKNLHGIDTNQYKNEKVIAKRIIIDKDPYPDPSKIKPGEWLSSGSLGAWPCKWIACTQTGDPPYVTAYRKKFNLDKNEVFRVHVSADERYELFLDGQKVGRGSERGDRENWCYETYEINLSKGSHLFVAKVWSLGHYGPWAQRSVVHGFLFAPEPKFVELLGTGVAPWEAKKLMGFSILNPDMILGSGVDIEIDGNQFSWDFEKGQGTGWEPVKTLHDGINGFVYNNISDIHLLKPALLPPMMEEERFVGAVKFVSDISIEATKTVAINLKDNLADEPKRLQALIKGKSPLVVPPHTRRRAIVDLEDYYCAYPEIVISGGKGGSIRLHWAESLFLDQTFSSKGNRGEIDGKYFYGQGDVFKPDGGNNRKFETLWWRCGRYLEILVQTETEPLTLETFKLWETRYPLKQESLFECDDKRLASIIPITLRSLQMCSHEAYMDCPYYEQLMYIGDAHNEILTTYVVTHDDRLVRKSLSLFDASRKNSGIMPTAWPNRETMIIPPFSLLWVAMVHDYAIWKDNPIFVKSLMPGVRSALEAFKIYTNKDGLIEAPIGWNFIDWVPSWDTGVPPDGDFGVSGLINWQTVYSLVLAGRLEEWTQEPELAARYRRQATELASKLTNLFWDEKRGLFADDLKKENFSEHTQCFAVLSGLVDPQRIEKIAQGLVTDKNLAKTSIYFSHYLFETYQALGKVDLLFDRLELWCDLLKLDLKTTIEIIEPTRSDCHAFGSHPLYHYFATILGIRPSSPGFKTVKITPQLGHLTKAHGKLVHPQGEIEVDFKMDKGKLKGTITLPTGVSGTFIYKNKITLLKEGKQII